MTRRPPSLRRVPAGQVPLPPRYYEGATTSRRHLAAFRLLHARNTIYRLRSSFVRSCGLVNAPSRRPGISYGNPFHFR